MPANKSLVAALAALSTAAAVHARDSVLIHVDASAPAGGDGQSWETAFKDLQDGLDAALAALPTASSQNPINVLVGPGVYRPDRGTLNRSSSFDVYEHIGVYGSYAGRSSPNPYLRVLITSGIVSILSGDLRGDDGPAFTNTTDNSHHVVRILSSIYAEPFRSPRSSRYGRGSLNGLSIRSGHADQPGDADGGGVLYRSNSWDDVYVSDCEIVSNQAAGKGGGFAGGRVELSDCVIRDNRATWGGAVATLSGMVLMNCLFERNTATVEGGAVYGDYASLNSCTLRGNTAQNRGGAIAARNAYISVCRIAGNAARVGAGVSATTFTDGAAPGPSDRVNIDNSLIAHNIATETGGAVAGAATLSFCTVVSNRALAGGAISPLDTRANGCIFWNNTAAVGPVAAGSEQLRLATCLVQDGVSSISVPMSKLTYADDNFTADPRFVDPIGTDPSPTADQDKDYRLRQDSPAVDKGIPPLHAYYHENDLDGQPRNVNATLIAYARPDLGALEMQLPRTVLPLPVVYVNAEAPVGGDGLSWQRAFRDIGQALDTPGVTQVWIAGGRYTPDRNTKDRTAKLLINRSGVELHGSFAGTESTLAQRTFTTAPTIISGDLLSNDSTSLVSRLDNSTQLLNAELDPSPTSSNPTSFKMSGLTFRAASHINVPVAILADNVEVADCAFLENVSSDPSTLSLGWQAGAGAIRIISPTTRIDRCRFVSNIGHSAGALALPNYAQSTTVVNDCQFIGNTSNGRGGAISAEEQALTLNRCSFIANLATNSSYAYGGAIYLGFSAIRADACSFIGNAAIASLSGTHAQLRGNGGAIGDAGNHLTSTNEFTNCVFASNVAYADQASGGAVSLVVVPRLVNCTIADNLAGGSLANMSSPQIGGRFLGTPTASTASLIANCIITNTTSPTTPAFEASWSSAGPYLSRSIIPGAPLPLPVGVVSIADPLFANPRGPDNVFGTADDDYTLRAGSPAIDAGNALVLPLSASTLDLGGSPRFIDDLRIANTGTGTPAYLDIGAYEHVCTADFDLDGRHTINDLFTFLNAWFSQSPRTDRSGNGAVNLDDLFIYLSEWFAGC